MIDLTLFDKPDCPFCWKVRFALYFKGLDYQRCLVAIDNKPQALLDISPKGTVPVLVTTEGVLDESAAIINWLERQHPQPPLLELATARELEYFSDKVVGPRIRDQIFMRRSKPEAEWDPVVSERCQREWETTLAELEPQCSATGPWLLGENPTVADCALGARFTLATCYGLTGLERFPNLARWFNQLCQSPAWHSATPPYIAHTLQNGR